MDLECAFYTQRNNAMKTYVVSQNFGQGITLNLVHNFFSECS